MKDLTVRKQRLLDFLQLMRLDKPIGSLLLLWPTLWALWLAADGTPSLKNVLIFTAGVLLMRSAGCIINDYADRHIDGHVTRTQHRPIPRGAVTTKEALVLLVILLLISFFLVLLTNTLTIQLAVVAVILAACYPFMKRFTHLPQVILGAAFAWGIPMAFAAETNQLAKELWALYAAVVLWTIVYDTFYAMVDREDDLKIGMKSTAILFGDMDIMITSILQVLVLIALAMTGANFGRGLWYYLALGVVAALFLYQQYLIRNRDTEGCFKAFLNNNYVGASIFIGLVLDYQLGIN